jgi:hypothetical protein
MAVTAYMSGPGARAILAGEIVYASDDILFSLHTSSISFSVDTTEFFDDVSATELATGGGYTAGGFTLGTKTSTYDTASNTAYLDAVDPSWTGSESGFGPFRWVVARKDTGVEAESPIIGAWDLGADYTVGDGNVFTAVLDSSTGWLSTTVT